MATDDYSYDQIERSQLHQTRRRRAGRSRRRRLYLLVGLILLALFVLGAPSLISHSPMGRSLVARTIAGYGLNTKIGSARIGWITPLRIKGLRVEGTQAGSKIHVEQLDSDITIGKLLFGSSDFGSVIVRGLQVNCSINQGRCSLEDDLASLLQPSDDGGSSTGNVQIQDCSLKITDTVSAKWWTLDQSKVEVQLGNHTQATFSGLIGDVDGGNGSLQGSYSDVGPADSDSKASATWKLDLESQSLPLSVLALIRQRFPELTASMPTQFAGDATGVIHLAGLEDGTIESSVQSLEVRNMIASHGRPGSRVWTNALASLNGDLLIEGQRIVGNNLTATTDFAAGTLNGAFSRSLTLVGEKDNPLMWLDALDGVASFEVDLAAFDHALPGLLPLRHDAKIISGRLTASVRALPNEAGHRSQLFVRSEAIRARANGRGIVFKPAEVEATVTNRDGTVRAEQFKLASSFASAVGQGSMRAGQADFQIDFGRLAATLRHFVDMSETTLGGTAEGTVQWNASNDNIWRLTGNSKASNLLISLADGRQLKQASLQSKLDAVGRWGGQALQELSSAKMSVVSNGLDLRAELARPVAHPTSATPLPIKLRGTGRIETLTQTVGPWLPPQLHDAGGAFVVAADAELSNSSGQLGRSQIELTEPTLAYGDRWFHQQQLKADFDGVYRWPSGEFHSRSLTIVGDAVSLAMKGEANEQTVDLEVAWRAKLERIQGSVKKRDRAWKQVEVQSASFQPGKPSASEDWVVMGDCQGEVTIKSHDHILDIVSETTGKNVAIVQPPSASAQSQTVGPMPRGRPVAFNRSGTSGKNLSRVVWSEPNLKLSGLTHYNIQSGEIVADGFQMSSDWLATTLTGKVLYSDAGTKVSLDGPARLKMNEVSQRLTTLFGTPIQATGIHETPLEIRASPREDGTTAFSVTGHLGWDSGEVGGVRFGSASVPVRLTETTVQIQPAVIPVDQGQLNFAGEVFYRPGPVWMRAHSGTSARNIRLTQQMTHRWMKYLAPLLANATRVDGTVGAEIDEAIIVIDNPNQSRVRGRLLVEGAQMYAGPLANQVINGVNQLKAIAQLNNNAFGAVGPGIENAKLVSMPAQTVEFAVDHGVVQHERLFFNIDRAQVITSGRVGFDGKLELVAQVPLDASWLGSDLQSLAGEPVALPVRGTLDAPRLDSSGVREVVLQLGSKAARSTAESYLQKQLNKGIESIFGR